MSRRRKIRCRSFLPSIAQLQTIKNMNSSNVRLREIIYTKELPYSILDLHFFKDTPYFTVVTSNGIISTYVVEEVETTHSLAFQGAAKNPNFEVRLKSSRDDFFCRKTWLTSFCWDDSPGTTNIFVTTDGGQVYRVELSEDAAPNRKFTKVLEHTDYAWCCAVAQEGGVIASGGDDSLLRLKSMYEETVHLGNPEQLEMDIQKPQKTVEEVAKSIPKFFSRAGEIREIKGHEAGVTAILPIACSPENEPCYFLTGSYDDHIRIWMVTLDTAYPGAPDKISCIKKFPLGGGVFRLKLLGGHTPIIPVESATVTLRFKVLASCMYNGAKLLEISGGEASTDWDIKILAEVNLHKSMVYACDAQTISNSVQNLIPDKEGKLVPIADEAPDAHRIFVSTSFYDKLLCVWRYRPEGKILPGIENKLEELAA